LEYAGLQQVDVWLLGQLGLLMSTFHVPSKALCAIAETGIRKDASKPIHSSFLIVYPSVGSVSDSDLTQGDMREYSTLTSSTIQAFLGAQVLAGKSERIITLPRTCWVE
jgi:hypothetical protein